MLIFQRAQICAPLIYIMGHNVEGVGLVKYCLLIMGKQHVHGPGGRLHTNYDGGWTKSPVPPPGRKLWALPNVEWSSTYQ